VRDKKNEEKVAASILYRQPLDESVFIWLEEALSGQELEVFFRADDIGLQSEQFSRMMHLFSHYRVPLCLALVPRWLDRAGWEAMSDFAPSDPLWCWHQHGYAHCNHEAQGKKNEFGPGRTREQVRVELREGRDHLRALLGELFCPVFTPPWNRCSTLSRELLRELGFVALSTSVGGEQDSALADFFVNLDLHTGKEKTLDAALGRLFADWQRGISQGRLGIMLHHQRMNEQAFVFLERLLEILAHRPGVTFRTFWDFIKIRD